jgi:hypothetical protein
MLGESNSSNHQSQGEEFTHDDAPKYEQKALSISRTKITADHLRVIGYT